MQKYVCVCVCVFGLQSVKSPHHNSVSVKHPPLQRGPNSSFPISSKRNKYLYLFVYLSPKLGRTQWREVYRHITWTTRYLRVTFRLTPGPFCEWLNSSSRFEKHIFYKTERVGVHGRVRWCLFSRKCLIQDQMWKSAHTRLPHKHIQCTYFCSWSIHLHESFINAVSALSHPSYAL